MTADTARRVVTIDVPVERILGVNQTNGRGWGTYAAHKTDVYEAAANAWLDAGLPRFAHSRVTIRCVFPTGNRRDPQNYASGITVKAALDALTDCDVWQDDRPPWMTIERVECVYERGASRVEIIISEQESEHVGA